MDGTEELPHTPHRECQGRVQSDGTSLQYPPRLDPRRCSGPHARHQRLMEALCLHIRANNPPVAPKRGSAGFGSPKRSNLAERLMASLHAHVGPDKSSFQTVWTVFGRCLKFPFELNLLISLAHSAISNFYNIYHY
jgi:hypothetical protein